MGGLRDEINNIRRVIEPLTLPGDSQAAHRVAALAVSRLRGRATRGPRDGRTRPGVHLTFNV